MKKVYSLLTMAVIVAMSLTMTSCDFYDATILSNS